MITRIPVEKLRVGMFIHKLGSSWLKHPFFRNSFLLDEPGDLQRIIDAGIDEVWIDETKGLSLADLAQAEAAAAASTAEPALEPEAEPEPELEPATKSGKAAAEPLGSMSEEIARARNICSLAKRRVVGMFEEARLGKAVDVESMQPLLEDISSAVERNASAILSVARLKTHDDYTYMHSVAVSALMVALARQLGLDTETTRLAGMGGLMHDLGKAFMPLEVLNKPGKLTDAEFDIMRGHPMAGVEALKNSGAPAEVVDIVHHHHEKMNGRGYPDGLKGEEISLLARMGAICDVYDAVTSVRPYKEPWNPATAMQEMARWEGHFDPQLFRHFVKSVGIYPVGTLVRLSSQHLAVVVEPGSSSLLKPVVRRFFSLRTNGPVTQRTIDLDTAYAGCRIEGPEDPGKWNFPYLNSLWQ